MARWRRTIVALAAAAALTAAASADSKWVRGAVVSVAGDSVVVKVKGTDMKFTVDAKTRLIQRGAGTADRAAEAAGQTGVKLAERLKSGDRVEVHYDDAGGALRAASIRSIGGGGSASSDDQGILAEGKVTEVAGDSVTVSVGGKPMTFKVDAQTEVVGRGVGTKAQQAGGKLALGDAVHSGDGVRVMYHQLAGGVLHAAEIRVTTPVR
jgi:hypothetical protein